MSNANFNVDTILKLVDLGLRVGTVLVERHSFQPISTMSDAEILAAIDKINIHTDSSIEAGEYKSRGSRQVTTATTTPAATNPAAVIPAVFHTTTPTITNPATSVDPTIEPATFDDEGDDQGHPV